jgi:hypothetical protein
MMLKKYLICYFTVYVSLELNDFQFLYDLYYLGQT